MIVVELFTVPSFRIETKTNEAKTAPKRPIEPPVLKNSKLGFITSTAPKSEIKTLMRIVKENLSLSKNAANTATKTGDV